MTLFEQAFLEMAQHANSELMCLLAVKNLVEKQKLEKELDPKKQEYFKNLLSRLIEKFDVDLYLEKLNDNFICLKFSPKSKHFLTYGNSSLCGRFIKVLGDLETEIKSKSGEYIKTHSYIGFRLEHKIGEQIDIAFADLVELEYFKN
jgi:hypothetical protein